MGSSGRLTTATDIPDGLIMNADVNANAAIALGKLAPMPVNNVMRSTGLVNQPGQVVNADIAPQVIRGGVDGANGRISPGSLYNTDIAVQQIRGGVDGVNSRLAAGSLNAQDLAANSVTGITYFNVGGGSIGPTYPGWGSYATCLVDAGPVAGRARLDLTMLLGASGGAIGAFLGYNLDAAGWNQMAIGNVPAGGNNTVSTFADLGMLTGAHNVYLGWMHQTAGGTLAAYSGSIACVTVLKR